MTDWTETVMGLIIHSGNAKSSAMMAIQEAKQGNSDQAEQLMKEADAELINAHNVQTRLLQSEAEGTSVEVSLLMVHAQDHLMTAITFKDLAKEIIELYSDRTQKKG